MKLEDFRIKLKNKQTRIAIVGFGYIGTCIGAVLAEIEEVNLLRRDSDRTNSNWMFAIHSHNRNELLNYLRSVGVGAVVHNRRNDKYSVFGGLRKDLPNLDRVDKTLLNLPIHHGVRF